MAGGIAFAAVGDFQAYSKQWRLFADVTNDVGVSGIMQPEWVLGWDPRSACTGRSQNKCSKSSIFLLGHDAAQLRPTRASFSRPIRIMSQIPLN